MMGERGGVGRCLKVRVWCLGRGFGGYKDRFFFVDD